MVSPGFFEPYLTVDNTLGMSDYSGEGFIYDLAINLEVLKFLQAVNSLTASDAKGATDFMQWSKLCIDTPFFFMTALDKFSFYS